MAAKKNAKKDTGNEGFPMPEFKVLRFSKWDHEYIFGAGSVVAEGLDDTKFSSLKYNGLKLFRSREGKWYVKPPARKFENEQGEDAWEPYFYLPGSWGDKIAELFAEKLESMADEGDGEDDDEEEDFDEDSPF